MGQHTLGALMEPPPPPQRKRVRTVGDRIRTGLRGIGQTLITAGLVVLLFVVYEVYVTSWFTHIEQTKLKKQISQEWASGNQDPTLQLPNGSFPNLKVGQGIANIYIPRLGQDFAWTIVEGTNDADLDKGPGHYVGTAMPGQLGNFAVAGHRVGKGEPFLNLDHLRPGDKVVIETQTDWFVYTILGNPADDDLNFQTVVATDTAGDVAKIPGREIVGSLNGNPLYAVPDHPGFPPSEKLITLTTCHPKFSASHRMIVYGVLDTADSTGQTADFTMPASIKALYGQVT